MEILFAALDIKKMDKDEEEDTKKMRNEDSRCKNGGVKVARVPHTVGKSEN